MDSTVLVCCKTLSHEIEKALFELGCTYPAIWVESGLHNFPGKLRAALQEILDSLQGVDRVILTFGSCGNSVLGLKTGNYEMILPRVDDCISLLMGSMEARKQYERTYFLTKGWLEGEQNIWDDYKYAIAKFGQAQGKQIMDFMLAGYKYLGTLDTQAYDLDSLLDTTKQIASDLGLENIQIPASYKYVKDLITGPWDSGRYIRINPHSEITYEDLTL